MKGIVRICVIVLFSVLPAVSACRPEGIIPPDAMVSLFTEFYQADATIELTNELAAASPVRVDSLRVYLPIIVEKGYTKEEFRASMDYYLRHPDDMSKIIGKVKARLDQEAKEAGKRIDPMSLDVEEEEDAVEERRAEGTEPKLEQVEDSLPVKGVRKDKPVKRKKVNKRDLRKLEEELKEKE